MAGSIQKTVILAAVEATSGTDAAPTAAANAVAIRVSGLKAKVSQKMATRDVVRGAFAAPDMLPYTRRGEVSFSVEMAGSGAAGTPPQWGTLLQGCGMAETITAGSRVEYTPASSGLKSLTLWAYVNGRLAKFVYGAGSVKLAMKVGQVPSFDFTFQALVTSVAASAGVTPTLSAWTRGLAVGPLSTSALKLGGAYAAGALTGGTDYNVQDFNIDLANDVQDLELAALENIAIYGRNPSASIVADINGAAMASLYADMAAGTPRSLGLVHGTTAGNKVLVYAPAGVLTDIDDSVSGNVMLNSLSASLQPSSAFNDEVRIVAM
jgi:hypothetical protein